MFEEPVSPRSPDPFGDVLGAEALATFNERASVMRDRLGERTVWHVNSTSRGGGVAEMLSALLAYDCGIGITNRWLVIDTDDEFLDVTKKIHNRLHGAPDDGDLGPKDKDVYERTLSRETGELAALISSGDVVVLHDPQVAGLAPSAKEHGATVFWRSHIGADRPDDVVRGAWTFLRPYVERADGVIFSREPHVWEGLPSERVAIIPPCIDAFSPKNQDMTDDEVSGVLTATGILAGSPAKQDPPVTLKPRRRTGDPIDPKTVLVAQVGRWDRLKDPAGVIEGFAQHVVPRTDAHLLLSGPLADQVEDDPDGAQVMKDVLDTVGALPQEVAARVHVIDVPLDGDRSALFVNAIQRHADVVVQKSLAEGFGLTVAEAMWKARPVVASRVGGIQDQIDDRRTGVLVDPRDLAAFGSAVTDLLTDHERARRVGENARGSVCERFLVPAHLQKWYEVLERTLYSTSTKATSCS